MIYMKDLPKEEQPRERLILLGVDHLSNREILAILLRTGIKNASAMSIADELMVQFGSLRGISQASFHEMTKIRGIGPAKACDIIVGFELAKRLSRPGVALQESVSKPKDAAALIYEELRFLDKEHFVILMLNTKHKLIGKKIISIGHLNSSLVHPRELFKEIIRHSSAAVILAHNHPSGDPTPSEDDIAVTRRLVEAGQILGIHVLDHLIVGDNSYVSFKELGLI